VGDGEGVADARRMVAGLELGDRITFPGAVTRPQDILARAQVFVLASNWEGLPLTVLEAMRAGLPVVASDVGGVAEAIDDGESGILVPRGGVNELSSALARLIDDPGLRAGIGSASRMRFEKDFTQERMLAGVAEVYRRLVPAPVAPAGA
jgi:glycosyltransferase involved in cell wall biosynthesis